MHILTSIQAVLGESRNNFSACEPDAAGEVCTKLTDSSRSFIKTDLQQVQPPQRLGTDDAL